MKKKLGRNEPCPCGSGKKFKKCCESKMIGKKYMAHKIESASQVSNKVSSLTSLIAPSIPSPAQLPEKKINISTPEEKAPDKEEKDLATKQPKKTAPKKTVKAPKKSLKKKTRSESS